MIGYFVKKGQSENFMNDLNVFLELWISDFRMYNLILVRAALNLLKNACVVGTIHLNSTGYDRKTWQTKIKIDNIIKRNMKIIWINIYYNKCYFICQVFLYSRHRASRYSVFLYIVIVIIIIIICWQAAFNCAYRRRISQKTRRKWPVLLLLVWRTVHDRFCPEQSGGSSIWLQTEKCVWEPSI